MYSSILVFGQKNARSAVPTNRFLIEYQASLTSFRNAGSSSRKIYQIFSVSVQIYLAQEKLFGRNCSSTCVLIKSPEILQVIAKMHLTRMAVTTT